MSRGLFSFIEVGLDTWKGKACLTTRMFAFNFIYIFVARSRISSGCSEIPPIFFFKRSSPIKWKFDVRTCLTGTANTALSPGHSHYPPLTRNIVGYCDPVFRHLTIFSVFFFLSRGLFVSNSRLRSKDCKRGGRASV